MRSGFEEGRLPASRNEALLQRQAEYRGLSTAQTIKLSGSGRDDGFAVA